MKNIFLILFVVGYNCNSQIPLERQVLNSNSNLTSVCFSTLTNLWICGTNGAVFNSTNSGETWQEFQIGTEDLNDVLFVSIDTGFICGDNGTVYLTTDAGFSWSNIDLSTNSDLQTIYSLNTSDIWIAGSNEIFKTSDLWVNWQYSPLTSAIMVNSITYINPNEGWFCGAAGIVKHTTDGGSNWSIQTTQYPDDYVKMQMLDGSTGYIISSSGRILYSSDGGTWIGQHIALNPLRDMEMLNHQKGAAVGDNGEFIYTEDFGSSWIQHPDILNDDLKGVSFFSDSSLCAVGSNGVVYVSKFNWAFESDSTLLDILVTFPNAFSPNNDGINDQFIIDGIKEYSSNVFTVFNRWGDIVFSVKDYNNGEGVWSGESNFGGQLEAGTYYFVFETLDNIQAKADWVQIVK